MFAGNFGAKTCSWQKCAYLCTSLLCVRVSIMFSWLEACMCESLYIFVLCPKEKNSCFSFQCFKQFFMVGSLCLHVSVHWWLIEYVDQYLKKCLQYVFMCVCCCLYCIRTYLYVAADEIALEVPSPWAQKRRDKTSCHMRAFHTLRHSQRMIVKHQALRLELLVWAFTASAWASNTRPSD